MIQDGELIGIAHWLFIDEASGMLVREITREGSQVFTTTFDDVRMAAGARRPFHWQTTGFGGPADVTVDSLAPAAVDGSAVTLPAGAPIAPLEPEPAPIALPAAFESDGIFISVVVNGRRSRFLLDTGTPEVLLDAGAAHRFGINPVFSHATIATLRAGRLTFAGLPIMTVPGIFGIDGILGYDLFAGSIVHIDYRHHTVDVLPRHAFAAPVDAASLPIRTDEGIPLAHGSIGTLSGERFALDTGSRDLLLPRYLWESRGREAAAIGGRMRGDEAPSIQHFLEGPVETRPRDDIDFRLGDWRFAQSSAQVEVQSAGATIDIPFDGIVGSNALDRFEWWFDYADGKAWLRPVG